MIIKNWIKVSGIIILVIFVSLFFVDFVFSYDSIPGINGKSVESYYEYINLNESTRPYGIIHKWLDFRG